jgi:hypothetical protein
MHVAGPFIELTRRAGGGRREMAMQLAELILYEVRAEMAGRPPDEVCERLRAALAENLLALTNESLEACVEWISRGDSERPTEP